MAKTVLKNFGVAEAKVYKIRLQNFYIPFLETLHSIFVEHLGNANKEAKKVEKILSSIKIALSLIDVVFSKDSNDVPRKVDVEKLYKTLSTIEVEVDNLQQVFSNDPATAKAMLDIIDAAHQTSQIDKKQLNFLVTLKNKSSRQKQEKVSSHHYGATGLVGSALHTFGISPRFAVGAGLASQIAAPLLGPLFGPAAILSGGGLGLTKLLGLGARGIGALGGALWKPHKENEPFYKTIGHGLGGIGKILGGGIAAPFKAMGRPFAEGYNWAMGRSGGDASLEEDIGGSPNVTSQFNQPSLSESTSGRTPFRLLSRRKKEESTESLFYFFNKRAYTAGWTRDVLKALRGGRGTGGSEGGIVDSIIGGSIGAGIVSAVSLALAGIKAITIVGTVTIAGIGIYDTIKKWFAPSISGDQIRKPTWYERFTPFGGMSWFGREVLRRKAREYDEYRNEKNIDFQGPMIPISSPGIKTSLPSTYKSRTLLGDLRKLFSKSDISSLTGKINAETGLPITSAEQELFLLNQRDIREAVKVLDSPDYAQTVEKVNSERKLTEKANEDLAIKQIQLLEKINESLNKPQPDQSLGRGTFIPPFDSSDSLLNYLNVAGVMKE